MVAYLGISSGNVATFSVDGNYDITKIATLKHDNYNGSYNSLFKIDATHYFLAYSGKDQDGYVKVFSIDEDYAITQVSVLEHDTSNAAFCSAALLDASHVVLSYSQSSNYFIKTFSIDGSYNITQINDFYSTNTRKSASVAKIDSTHFAIAYTDFNNKGRVATYSVNGSYVIAEIQNIEHDANKGEDNCIVLYDPTHLMLMYRSSTTPAGKLKIFAIGDDYKLTTVETFTNYVMHTSSNLSTSMVKVDATRCAVSFSGADSDGYISVVSVDDQYNVSEVMSLEFDESYCMFSSLIKLSGNYFVVAYESDLQDGTVKTILIRV